MCLELFGDECAKTIVRQRVVPDSGVGWRREWTAATAIVAQIHIKLPAAILVLVRESTVLDDIRHIDNL